MKETCCTKQRHHFLVMNLQNSAWWPGVGLLLRLRGPCAGQQRLSNPTPLVGQGPVNPVGIPELFVVKVPVVTIRRICQRVQQALLPDLYAGAEWADGPDPTYLAQLRARWLHGYDWRATEARSTRFPNYRVQLGGIRLHYLLEKGSQPRSRPLLVLHGWPPQLGGVP